MIGSVMRRAMADRSGASAVEYGMIAGLISVLLVAWLAPMAAGLESMMTQLGAAIAQP